MVDREQLLLLMLEGGTKFLRLTREALVAGDLRAFGENLGRAQAIIAELHGTLDHEVGGTITRNLARLYDFMLFHLTQANAEKSLRQVDEVIGLFSTIADAFRTAIGRETSERAATTAA